MSIEQLKGKTITKIEGEKGSDELIFHTKEGPSYRMHHYQDCCETVDLNDVIGDLADLIGNPILEAEEVSNEGTKEEVEQYESCTWTFYKLGTIRGHVTLRWLGISNGYYSESVNFEEITGSKLICA